MSQIDGDNISSEEILITITELNMPNFEFYDFLSFCDGHNSLLDIAEKVNFSAWDLYAVAEKLVSHDLIRECD